MNSGLTLREAILPTEFTEENPPEVVRTDFDAASPAGRPVDLTCIGAKSLFPAKPRPNIIDELTGDEPVSPNPYLQL